MSTAVARPDAAEAGAALRLGRVFVSAPFDTLLVGGGLSLIAFALLALGGQLEDGAPAALTLPFLVLALNSAHFAASTVRLYTMQDSFARWPFLTLGLPLATLVVLTAAIAWPGQLGRHLQALYLTWSPFHYAAQAFGLACLYHYRSGGALSPLDRRLLYATCLLPFLYAFVGAEGVGVDWLVPSAWLSAGSSLRRLLDWTALALAVGVFAAPVALALKLARGGGGALPAIGWLIVLTNGIWWVVFPFYRAFVWATVFHGLQYLAIAMIFHVRDQTARPGNRRRPWVHALRFYAASFALGYLLFNVWPFAYLLAGFGLAESLLLCAAVINIHHFIVDRYIWRLRGGPNRAVVESVAA